MKLNSKNIEKLSVMLNEANGKARVRTLTISDIHRILDKVFVTSNITKKALKGTIVQYTGAEQFPNAYKYIPYSTQFTAIFVGDDWDIESVYRKQCPNRRTNTIITFSDTAKSAIMERMTYINA